MAVSLWKNQGGRHSSVDPAAPGSNPKDKIYIFPILIELRCQTDENKQLAVGIGLFKTSL